MLHGGFGDISDFQKVIPKLSKQYRLIIPDAPGLGRSEYADSILSYQLLADYNSIFIDQLKLDRVYVVGWSDGANTALLLAKSRGVDENQAGLVSLDWPVWIFLFTILSVPIALFLLPNTLAGLLAGYFLGWAGLAGMTLSFSLACIWGY